MGLYRAATASDAGPLELGLLRALTSHVRPGCGNQKTKDKAHTVAVIGHDHSSQLSTLPADEAAITGLQVDEKLPTHHFVYTMPDSVRTVLVKSGQPSTPQMSLGGGLSIEQCPCPSTKPAPETRAFDQNMLHMRLSNEEGI